MTVVTFEPDAHAPQLARRLVARELSAPDQVSLCEVAQLLVSELVTNAVVHAASAVEVEVLPDDTGVTVRVRDADTGPLVTPGGRAADPDGRAAGLDEGGRGFVLVDRLAEAWGTEHSRGRKTVWFRLRADDDASDLSDVSDLADLADLADPSDLSGASGVSGAAAPAAGTSSAPVRTFGHGLHTLLLPPALAQALTFEQHVGELLARIVDSVDATGAAVTLATATEPVAAYGSRTGARTSSHDLVVGDRRVGVLTVHLDRQDDDPDTDAFTRLAADRLALLAAQHGVVKAELQREAELDYLAEATEMLASSLSVALTLTLVTQIVVPRLADWCAAFAVDERGRARRLCANHRREERADAVNALLDGDTELRQAVAAAARGAAAHRLPATVSVAGQRAHVVVLPLTTRARPLGVLVLGRAEPVDAVGFMATLELGRRAALAVDNARLYEEQVAAATALQASLLPSALPSIDGVELAARYHSAAPGLLVGGDFYDAFALSDGSFVVAIGDVCGKGAEAAAVTGMSRDILRLLLQDGRDVPTALRRLNSALIENLHDSRFCTVALARFESKGEELIAWVCLAGHPEPVILRADGSTELAGTSGDLLGVLADDALDLTEAEIRLLPGDALVLYTDGITERRNGRRMFGSYGLRQTLERATGGNAGVLAQQIEQAARSFVDTDLRDDLAILVVRRSPHPPA